MSLNHTLFYRLYDFAHQSFFVDQVIIFIAEYFPFIVGVSAILFIVYHRHQTYTQSDTSSLRTHILEFLVSMFVVCVMWGIVALLKVVIGIPRPFLLFSDVSPLFVQSGYAFPSGHTALFGALAGTIFVFHKRVGLVFLVLALCIGFARVFAGVHYPIDILGGFIIGFGGALLLYQFLRK